MVHTLGLDLAGSLTATGGVGAALASTTGSESFNYLYDGNGNVISTCDSKGEITAKLAYSPFGEKLFGADLPFTFSTKTVDSSGLSYYGARYYSMELGRWLNKDKSYESGGVNVYCFCKNIPLTYFDVLGFYPVNGITFDEVSEWIRDHAFKDGLFIGSYTFDKDSVEYDLINFNVIVEWTEDVPNNQCSGCKIYKTNCSGYIHYTSYSNSIDLPELSPNVSFSQNEMNAWMDFYTAISIHEMGHKEITSSLLGVNHYIDAFGEDCGGFEYAREKCNSNLVNNAAQYNSSLLGLLSARQLEYDNNYTNPVDLPWSYQ